MSTALSLADAELTNNAWTCRAAEANPAPVSDASTLYRWGKALAPHSLFIDTDGVWGWNSACARPTLDYCVAAFDVGNDMISSPGKYVTPTLDKPLLGHEFGNW